MAWGWRWRSPPSLPSQSSCPFGSLRILSPHLPGLGLGPRGGPLRLSRSQTRSRSGQGALLPCCNSNLTWGEGLGPRAQAHRQEWDIPLCTEGQTRPGGRLLEFTLCGGKSCGLGDQGRPGDTTVLPQPLLALTLLLLNSAPLPRLPGPAEAVPLRSGETLPHLGSVSAGLPAGSRGGNSAGARLFFSAELGHGLPLARLGERREGFATLPLSPSPAGQVVPPAPPSGRGRRRVGNPLARTHACSLTLTPSAQPEAWPPPFLCCKASHFPRSLTAIGTKPQKVRCSQACFLRTPPRSASAPPAFLTNSAPFPPSPNPRGSPRQGYD